LSEKINHNRVLMATRRGGYNVGKTNAERRNEKKKETTDGLDIFFPGNEEERGSGKSQKDRKNQIIWGPGPTEVVISMGGRKSCER